MAVDGGGGGGGECGEGLKLKTWKVLGIGFGGKRGESDAVAETEDSIDLDGSKTITALITKWSG